MGQDHLLKFKQSIRMGKRGKGDLVAFEYGRVFCVRQVGWSTSMSKTADTGMAQPSLGFTENSQKRWRRMSGSLLQ